MPPRSTQKPNKLTVLSDLAARSSLLAGRLEKKEYRPETILTMDKSGWPGDWEGRTILALCRLAEVTHREPAFLREIIDVVLDGTSTNTKPIMNPVRFCSRQSVKNQKNHWSSRMKINGFRFLHQ